MCQLLAMNSSKPAALGFSFEGFVQRGDTEHKDGWGIAIHTNQGCRLITDHLSSTVSTLATALRQQPVKAKNIVAHIRKATQGRIAPENSHPFARLLWGRDWSFAHNGDLKTFAPAADHEFICAGDTDSERAFCHLLARLRDRFGATQPAQQQLTGALEELAREIAGHGSFNFVLSNGVALYAFCSTHLHYVVRQYPFSVAQLIDCDKSIDFSQHNHLDDRIAVIATHPLTSNEEWVSFAPGQLLLFSDGQPQLDPGRPAPSWRWC